MKRNKNFFYIIPIISLSIYFLIRLINQSKITKIFPFDFANDHSAHMAKIFFLKAYGYGNIVPNWWNGFPLLKFYHPFSTFYEYPFYLITNNIQIAIFTSLIFTYILSFIAIWYLCKKENIDKIKRTAFFLFFFASPIGIGYFLRVGKYAEILGFLITIILFTLFLHYKNKKLDKKFLIFIPLYALLLLTHISVFIVFSFILLGFWLIKDNKDKIKLIIYSLISLLISSFWWYPFITGIKGTFVSNFYGLKWITAEGIMNDEITLIILTASLWLTFILYYKTNKISKKEIIFYSPLLISNLLLISRVMLLIPIFNRPIIDTYNLFFLFFTIFFLLKIKLEKLPSFIKKSIVIAIIIIPLIGIYLSINITPWFIDHTQEDKETIELMKYIDNKFYIIGSKSYRNAYFSYAAIYYNLSNPAGWGAESIPMDYRLMLKKLDDSFYEEDCDNFKEYMEILDVNYIISYNKNCEFLEKCGLEEIKTMGNSCLFNR
jgi:hypothetical protein